MERVLDGLVLVEVDRLDTAIFVADIESPVGRVKGQRLRIGRQEEGAQETAGVIIPGNGCAIICSRQSNVVSTRAVTHSDGGDGGAVVGEGTDGGVRRLTITAGWRFRKG